MGVEFRIIDSGVRDGRRQIAFDAALIELHRAGSTPDTLRFLRFPPTVLIGRHQAMWHEVDVEACLADGVGLVRRITGGGAIYLDEGQVGWELVLSRKRLPMPTLGDYTRAICEAVAGGLSSAFGIDARFRPRNDIEVGGRKLCGTGGFFDGDTLIYQGTVLVDVDTSRMMSLLKVPKAKLEKHALDRPEDRVTTLKALLGQAPPVDAVHAAIAAGLRAHLGIEAVPGTISTREQALEGELHDEEIGTDAFVFSIDNPNADPGVRHASLTGSGGTIAAYIRTEGDGPAERLREVLLTGDFFVTPPRVIFDLEASLRGIAVTDAGPTVEKFFAANRPDMLSMAPADFARVVRWAIAGAQTA